MVKDFKASFEANMGRHLGEKDNEEGRGPGRKSAQSGVFQHPLREFCEIGMRAFERVLKYSL